jgi:hypothetical protein
MKAIWNIVFLWLELTSATVFGAGENLGHAKRPDCMEEYQSFISDRYKDYERTYRITTCKMWPATGLMIFATSIIFGENADLEMVVLDPLTRNVMGENRESGVLDAGAIHSHEVIIDTAPYQLNESHTAFGIRILWTGSSQPNPYSSTSLNLYILLDKMLINILKGLAVQERIGEWDMRCAGSFQDRTMTLRMKHAHTPNADIVVRETVINTTSQETDESCKTNFIKRRVNSYTLKYNDGYAVPDNLKALSYR